MKIVRKHSMLVTIIMLFAVLLIGTAMIMSSSTVSQAAPGGGGGSSSSHSSSSSSSGGGGHSSSSSSSGGGGSSSSGGGGSSGSFVTQVIAWNDLGMHCACPTFEGFLILPPYNTLRAQVITSGGAKSGYNVTYALVENTDASLQADPYFSSWIKNAPKLFPGFKPVVSGKVVGLTGKGLAGTMDYNSTSNAYIAPGIPAYPALDTQGMMTDPLGGPKRNPYLTANITAKDSTGKTVATTSTVVPIAFGGCCGCHLKLAAANGYPGTPAGSFAHLGVMHAANSSKINIAMIDPDGDGVGGPVRCSWCHWDPAMGESQAPGVPVGYKLLPGANFTVKKSVYSFSEVLHRFHNNSALVQSSYDRNISTNCYDCHPGNGVDCYRGVHKGKSTLWCVDCHGNLNQRIATNQLKQPWQQSTLPTCFAPSPGITSTFSCHNSRSNTTTFSGLFGKFINGKLSNLNMLCETCHGSPHAEAPSALAKDNVQLNTIQKAYSFPTGKNSSYPFGNCGICHSDMNGRWGDIHTMGGADD